MNWEPIELAGRWYVRRKGPVDSEAWRTGGEFHRSRPARYRPQGAIIGFRSERTAQRRADELNQADGDCPNREKK